jgi:hypothetical protein
MLRLIAGLLRRPAGGLRPTAPSHDTVLGHLAASHKAAGVLPAGAGSI